MRSAARPRIEAGAAAKARRIIAALRAAHRGARKARRLRRSAALAVPPAPLSSLGDPQFGVDNASVFQGARPGLRTPDAESEEARPRAPRAGAAGARTADPC